MNRKLISLCSIGLIAFSCLPVQAFSESLSEVVEAPIVEDSSQESTDTTSEEGTAATETEETTTTEETMSSSETSESTIDTTETSATSEAQPDASPASTPAPEVSPAHSIAESVPTIPVLAKQDLFSDVTDIKIEKNADTEEFIAAIGKQARKIAKEHDLFASIMLAQAILESGSGGSQLSQAPHYNLFGIKGEYEGEKVVFLTYEDSEEGYYQVAAAFRSYPSYKESFEDYAKLLKQGIEGNRSIYEKAWKSKAETYQKAAAALTGTYATDRAYDRKLIQLIEAYDLDQYDREETEGVEVAGMSTTASTLTFPAYDQVNYDSGNRYAAGNCTQYVYNRITQLGGFIDLDMGNGNQWDASGRARGYAVSTTPKAGTAACFQSSVLAAHPVYGHVAFVERVEEDGSILISEMNVLGIGIVSFRTIRAEDASTLTYITPK
ncbi:glucosaminidase domain-containing protein [Enterococcus larvae]|uniref:glucosaminidase domain-containing protein n=1 Tax=Enterococcus larvae TaxID=2794352 RepID=UPI003F332803